MTQPPTKPRAFTLIQTLAALVLIAAGMVLAGQFFVRDHQLFKQIDSSERSIAVNTQLLRQLRADVWRASNIQTPTPHQLLLTQTHGRIVQWQTSAHTPTLTRSVTTAGNHATQSLTFHLPFSVTFQAHDFALSLTCGKQHTRLVSQVLAARRSQP